MTVELGPIFFAAILFCFASFLWRVLYEAKHLRLVERRVSELEEKVGDSSDEHDPDFWKKR